MDDDDITLIIFFFIIINDVWDAMNHGINTFNSRTVNDMYNRCIALPCQDTFVQHWMGIIHAVSSCCILE